MTDSLSKAKEKYENLIAMDDFNVVLISRMVNLTNLEEFCTLFNLKILINKETCWIVYPLSLESIPRFSSVIGTAIFNSLIAGI